MVVLTENVHSRGQDNVHAYCAISGNREPNMGDANSVMTACRCLHYMCIL
jgi:hypothetical protein